MKKMLSFIAPLAIIVALVMGYFSVTKAQQPSSYVNLCSRYDKAVASLESERTFAFTQRAKDRLDTRISEVWQQKKDAIARGECKTSSSSSSTTTSTSAQPTGNPTTTPSSAEPSENISFPHFFYYDDGKVGARDFGPPVIGDVKEQIDAEFWHRLDLDPALAAAIGHEVLGEPENEADILQKTRALATDKVAHDAYVQRVKDALNYDASSIEMKGAGSVRSAYMVDIDGIPSVLYLDVNRPEPYRVYRLATHDGRTVDVRLDCGFQPEGPTGPLQEQPVQPTEPVAPSTTTPPVPTTTAPPTGTVPPGTPETPGIPETPETPETPEAPESPGTPSEPGKDPSLDPQEQGNIPEQVGDGDDTLPQPCENGGVRDRDGVCIPPGDPAVEQPAPDYEYTAPAAPEPEATNEHRPVQPAPDNAPEANAPEVGSDEDREETRHEAEENSDPEDNPFGEAEED